MVNKKENILKDKSYAFGLRVIKAYKFLNKKNCEYALSNQLLRSGTAIGALIREAEYAQSTADFINKMSIALKETNETEYWLMLLKDSNYITDKMFNSIIEDCQEILRLLISTIKTSKLRKNK